MHDYKRHQRRMARRRQVLAEADREPEIIRRVARDLTLSLHGEELGAKIRFNRSYSNYDIVVFRDGHRITSANR